MKKLKELFGDDKLVEKYISLLKIETPKMMDSMMESFNNDDYNNVSIISHGLKSQLNYLDIDNLVELAEEIEVLAEMKKFGFKKILERKIIHLRIKLNHVIDYI